MKKEEALLEYAQIKQKVNKMIEDTPKYSETIAEEYMITYGQMIISEIQRLINHVDKMIGNSNVNKLGILEGLE